MKQDFYIFLDIDGVLNDLNFIKSLGKKGGIVRELKPESIEALNYLINYLNNTFKTKLVITSTWRNNIQLTEKTLYNYGLKYKDKILSTGFSSSPKFRGEEILEFLKNQNFKPNFSNFVIIDDEMFDFENHFPKEKIIKTSFQNQALCKEDVNKFINSTFVNEKSI